MIGQVVLTLLKSGVEFNPYEMYGLYLIGYDVAQPTPRVYHVDVEGRNGTIDMTEWAGEVFYGNREISLRFRDMHGTAGDFMNQVNGQRMRVYFPLDMPGWYYQGRCENVTIKTQRHVSDITLSVICHPFRYPDYPVDDYAASATGQAYSGHRILTLTAGTNEELSTTDSKTRILHQEGTSNLSVVISGIDSTAGATAKITVNGTDYAITANGAMENPPAIKHGDNTLTLTVTGYDAVSAEITFKDQVI